MITVLLVRTQDEGIAYARGAGLSPRDTWVVTPEGAVKLEGLRLTRDDLIAEFPRFREHPQAHEVLQVLDRSITMGAPTAGKPEWRKIGT